MTSVSNPLYNQFFINSTPEECKERKETDFSITTKTWVDTAKSISLLILKIIIIPWGLYEGIRWCVQRLAMTAICPAQSWIVKTFAHKPFQTQPLDAARCDFAKNLQDKGFIVRHIKLERDGVPLSGLLIGHSSTIKNKKWALQALGNCQPIEDAYGFAENYKETGYNLLLVNYPGVGRSQGFATPKTMGESQETAIRFLEETLQAEKIILAGYSIGGGAIGEAILQHDFPEDTSKYLVVRQMTFSRISTLAAHLFRECFCKNFTENLVHWASCEMDNVKSSQKLQNLNIREIIIQGEEDEVIPYETSLMKPLWELEIEENKEFRLLEDIHHNDATPVLQETLERIYAWDQQVSRPTSNVA